MRRILVFSVVVLFAFGAFAFGQQDAAPASTPTSAAAPVAPASGGYVLREGSDVELQFAQDLSSDAAAEDDPVAFTLANDLKVGNVVVAKAGAKAFGVVTKVQRAGMLGKAGKLNLRLEYLKTGDAKIKLRGSKGKGNGTVELTASFGLIRHGRNVDIKEGAPLHAYVAEDVALMPVPTS